MNPIASSLFLVGITFLSGCADSPRSEVFAADGVPAGPRFVFENVAESAGLDVVLESGDPRRWYIFESNGSGAAWLDYDVDGDLDLFIGNGAMVDYIEDGARLEVQRSSNCRLYRNDGNLKFTDVSAAMGADRWEWVNSVSVGDFDRDHDPDLYLGCFGRDVYLRNDGERFVDATIDAGLGNDYWSAGVAVGDPDLDGDLDLYVANYVEFDLDAPPAGGKRAVIDGVQVGWGPIAENKMGYNPGAPNIYFENDGNGHFRDATIEHGLTTPMPFCSYSAVFTDVTGDGLPDLLVANDLQRSQLYINRGSGQFEEASRAHGFTGDGEGQPTSAMGLALADVDNDGDLDVFRSNFDMEPNSLHINNRRGRFRERGRQFGLAQPSEDRLGWGAAFFDAELDGDLDLIVANGHVYPQAEEIGMHPWEQISQLFEAVPHDQLGVKWRDATLKVAGGGLALARSSRGLAIGDADNDGDVDVLILDIDHPPRLLENKSPRRGHWLAVKTVGSRSNTEGYGARVRVKTGEITRTAEVMPVQGLYSTHDPRVHFGLGPVEEAEWLEIQWPSGIVQRIDSPALDELHVVYEPNE